jgi:hypothetical protein
MEVLGQWKHGIVYPSWAAGSYWGYGEARFIFYPPASWTLGAALGAVLPWKMVPGAYCWIVMTLAGTAMYRLARECLPPSDALFAAVFYALNPYNLLIVYWRSAYAELMAAVLLPLLMLCIVRLNEPGPLPTLRLSLTLAAAWLTNIPAAVMIHYSAAGLVVVLAMAERPPTGPRWRPIIRTGVAMVLGAGLASFYLVPAIYEQRWVNIGQVMSPGVRPQDNFLFTTLADLDHNRFNLLVSVVALGEIGVLGLAIWLAGRKKNVRTVGGGLSLPNGETTRALRLRLWGLFSAWGAGSVILMFSVSNVLWKYLPKLRFVQLPFRWLLCMNAALAMLLALAAKRWRSRLPAPAFLLALVILAGNRIQPPWWETGADIREMSKALGTGAGYEGTDEYVPIDADASVVNKNLPRISDDAGAPVPSKILAWAQTEKHFTVHANAPENLTMHLFNYPAWRVVVNGKPTPTQTTDGTGLMMIPIAAGDSDVQISFHRTIDRFAGLIVSLLSAALLIVEWLKAAVCERRPSGIGTARASPVA